MSDIIDRPVRLCELDGCNNKHRSRGFCHKHYQRLYEAERRKLRGKTCSVDDCGGLVVALGYCSMHWQRFRRTGNPGSAARLRRQHEGVTYSNAHDAIRRLWGSASQYQCVKCPAMARQWAYDGSDPSQIYGPNHNQTGWHLYSLWPEFYMPMCVGCHVRRDGANAKRELHEYRLLKYGAQQ